MTAELIAGTAWQLYWPSLGVVMLFALAERCWPMESQQPLGAMGFNLVWHALFLAIFMALVLGPWGRVIGGLAYWIPAPLISRATTPESNALRIVLAILAHDFFVYWGHRLMHAVPALWAFHRFHHDEVHLNASTSLRQHWLSIPVHQLLVFLPLTWLFGVSATPAAVYYALIVLGAFHHANLRIALGPLTAVITGPQYHRLHHAPARACHDSNYASLFPVWDLLFGTYRAPKPGEFPVTGLAEHAPSSSQWRALVMPFDQWIARRAGWRI